MYECDQCVCVREYVCINMCMCMCKGMRGAKVCFSAWNEAVWVAMYITVCVRAGECAYERALIEDKLKPPRIADYRPIILTHA